MPLAKGSSKKTISANIATLMNENNRTWGKNDTPAQKQKQAIAIAFSTAGKTKKPAKKKKKV